MVKINCIILLLFYLSDQILFRIILFEDHYFWSVTKIEEQEKTKSQLRLSLTA